MPMVVLFEVVVLIKLLLLYQLSVFIVFATKSGLTLILHDNTNNNVKKIVYKTNIILCNFSIPVRTGSDLSCLLKWGNVEPNHYEFVFAAQ